jgi:hypothetical protein
MLSKILLLCFAMIASCQMAFAQLQPSQNSQTQNPLGDSTLQPNSNPNGSRPQETVIQYFNDPITGKPMEVVRVDVPVTVHRQGTKELTEKRIEMQWVVENRTSTQLVQTPSDQVHLEPQWVGWLNPRLVYVPRPNYQTQAVPITQPVRYPKYVEVERKVQVPDVVQATEYRTHLYQRERTAQDPSQPTTTAAIVPNDANLGTQLRPNPMQIAANQALAERNSPPIRTQPIQANNLPAASFSNAPPMSSYAATTPLIQLPGKPISNALSGIQRSFQQSFASVQRSPVYPPLSSSTLRPATVHATPALPQTAALPGSFRDPTQTGLGATILR